MGLDMNLSAKKFISGYSHAPDPQYQAVLDLLGMEHTPEAPYVYVTVGVAYWRKANSIHQWFVDNVQGGRDECQEAYVEREQLQELRDLCGEVLENPEHAAELLPSQEGFFFGSTEYDEGYFMDVRETYNVLTKLLNNKSLEDYSFVYQSSW